MRRLRRWDGLPSILGGEPAEGHLSRTAQGGLPEDVEDEAARFDNEEPTDAPRLVGQWVDDVIAVRNCASMNGIDIIDLDGQVGTHLFALQRLARGKADLGGGIGR